MAHDKEFDQILASLAESFLHQSDTLLDLRFWSHDPARAGSCMKAYFQLVEHSPGTEKAIFQLAALRDWLESHLNIVVFDAKRSVCLESLPLALEGETDLSEFCHSMMRRLRDDRCLAISRIHLEFRFSSDLAIAV